MEKRSSQDSREKKMESMLMYLIHHKPCGYMVIDIDISIDIDTGTAGP